MKKEKIKCKICGKLCKSYKSLAKHVKYTHNITSKAYYDKFLKRKDEEICPTCGNTVDFINISAGYKRFCNCKCANSNKEKIQLTKNIMLEKYGVEQPFQSDIFKEKARQTSLKKYGVDHPRKSKVVQEKAKATCLKKYGAENPFASVELKEKYQNKFLNKYNTKCPANADGGKKAWETKLKNRPNDPTNQQKIQQTNFNKYGVKCTFQVRDFRLKAIATQRANGNKSSYEDKLEKYFIDNNIKYIQEYNKDKRYPFFCDFYLPETDTFIEINGYWTHNNHFFDKNNIEDIKTLEAWKEKVKCGYTHYKDAIEVWTIYDLKKLEYAKKNNLNYIVLWNLEDIDNYILEGNK